MPIAPNYISATVAIISAKAATEHVKLVLAVQLMSVIRVETMGRTTISCNTVQQLVSRLVQLDSFQTPLHSNAKFVILIVRLV